MVHGEGENFFSREKKFSPSPNPIPFQEKVGTTDSDILCSRWSQVGTIDSEWRSIFGEGVVYSE